MLKAIHKKYLSKTKLLNKRSFKNGKGKVFRYSKVIPVTSVTMLVGALAVSGFIPSTWISFAFAAEQASNGTSAYSGDVQLTANVTEPGLSVTLPTSNSATLNLAPPFSGYDDTSASVLVRVGSRNNYKLYMSGDTSLKDSSNSNNATTIPTLDTTSCSSGCTLSDDTNFSNAWGYAIGANSDSYYGLKTAASLLASDTTTVTGGNEYKDYTIKFGAKVNYEVTPGTYTGTVNFIAVADVDSNIYMQYMTINDCATEDATGENGATTVIDIRDGKEYKVKQLKDGRCWMLDNLALDPTNENTIMNEYNTNASATTLAAFKNGASSVEGLDNTSGKYATSGIMANPNVVATYPYWGKSDTESGNNCVEGDTDPTTGCTDNWTVPRINTSKIPNSTNPDNPVAHQYPAWSPNSTSENHDATIPSYGSYNIGVYYNYCAASAGSYCYTKEHGTGNTTEDICPAGWRLPTGGNSGEFQNLWNKYDQAAINGVNHYRLRAALSISFSGVIGSSSMVNNINGDGWWPSSTRYINNNEMYVLYMYSASVSAVGHQGRSSGQTVRCVLQ